MTDSIEQLKRRAGIITEARGQKAQNAARYMVNMIRTGQVEEAIRAFDQIQDGGTSALTAILTYQALEQTDQGAAFIKTLSSIAESK